jgi:hypothetical protein
VRSTRIRERLTYANVVATLALIVAVAGGSTAIAITAAKNSVTSKSIRKGNVTANDLTAVRNASAEGLLVDPVPNDGIFTPLTLEAKCPGKSRAISGGVTSSVTHGAIVTSTKTQNGWLGRVVSDQGPNPVSVAVNVSCLLPSPAAPRS